MGRQLGPVQLVEGQEIKGPIREIKKTNPHIEKSIFNAIHAVSLDTFPGYKSEGAAHSFLERFDRMNGEGA